MIVLLQQKSSFWGSKSNNYCILKERKFVNVSSWCGENADSLKSKRSRNTRFVFVKLVVMTNLNINLLLVTLFLVSFKSANVNNYVR